MFIGSSLSAIVFTQPSASYSSDVNLKTRMAGLRRGTGGHSSFNGLTATVFGATGFLGSYVCNKLGKTGTQLVLPYRGDFYQVQPLKLVGDLGQVLFTPYYLRDEDSLRKAMKYSNVVINLIGRDWETRNFSFEDIYHTGMTLATNHALSGRNRSYVLLTRSPYHCSYCQRMWSRAIYSYVSPECH